MIPPFDADPTKALAEQAQMLAAGANIGLHLNAIGMWDAALQINGKLPRSEARDNFIRTAITQMLPHLPPEVQEVEIEEVEVRRLDQGDMEIKTRWGRQDIRTYYHQQLDRLEVLDSKTGFHQARSLRQTWEIGK